MENKYPNKGTVVFECGCWKIKKIGNLPSFGLFYLKIEPQLSNLSLLDGKDVYYEYHSNTSVGQLYINGPLRFIFKEYAVIDPKYLRNELLKKLGIGNGK